MMQRHQLMAVLLLALLTLGTSPAAVAHESEYSHGAQGSAGPAWLVRDDIGNVRTTETSGPEPSATGISGWQRAGAYGLEFGGAALGTAAAGAALIGTGWAMNSFLRIPEEGQEFVVLVAGTAAVVAYNPILVGTGTHLGGNIAGQRGTFWHTLVGSFAGSVAGTSLAYGYESWWTSHHNYSGPAQALISLSCIVVPTWVGAVIVHDAWK